MPCQRDNFTLSQHCAASFTAQHCIFPLQSSQTNSSLCFSTHFNSFLHSRRMHPFHCPFHLAGQPLLSRAVNLKRIFLHNDITPARYVFFRPLERDRLLPGECPADPAAVATSLLIAAAQAERTLLLAAARREGDTIA